MKSTELLFQLVPSSGTPIYRQVMEQFQRMVASGRLVAGDGLPSVRHLASRLEVNPMTISKAYSLLETQGLVERQRGKGMRVASGFTRPESLAARLALLQPTLAEAARQSEQLGIDPEQALRLFDQQLRKST